jgi:hypothetical protein
VSHADEHRRQREPPWAERFEGSRTWTPDREQRRRGEWPDRITIDHLGQCDVPCVCMGTGYKDRDDRCETGTAVTDYR